MPCAHRIAHARPARLAVDRSRPGLPPPAGARADRRAFRGAAVPVLCRPPRHELLRRARRPGARRRGGIVTFSGRVVGSAYVVVRHGDGLLATYGGLPTSSLRPGAVVATGSFIGAAAGRAVLRPA